MSKTKLISIRVDEEVLQKIEKVISHFEFYNRSNIINGLLQVAIDAMDEVSIINAVRYHPRHYDIQPIKIDIRRKENRV